jgi:hypothetical protein
MNMTNFNLLQNFDKGNTLQQSAALKNDFGGQVFNIKKRHSDSAKKFF